MIILTGGAGFIGSNLLKKLNNLHYKDIILFDNLNKLKKKNIAQLSFKSIYFKDEIFNFLKSNKKKISIIFHFGACTNTLEKNWDYLYKNNFEYSKKLAIYSAKNKIKFIYASSASIYGKKTGNFDEIKNLNFFKPLNFYAQSKLNFDKYIINNFKYNNKIIGLRFFNVYGKNENHKKNMASPIHSFSKQILNDKSCKIFGKFDGYSAGYHKRDFISVDDCTKINVWLMKKKINKMNIINIGTGNSVNFIQIARQIIKNLGYGKIKTIKFPEKLKNGYQSYTKANLKRLRQIGYKFNFIETSTGIKNFINDVL
tara:strand:+ start:135 stop:1073 length:939 start_codon:yes stop_codon:yes gene_type:complete